MDTLNIDGDELERLFDYIKSLPDDGENSKEEYVKKLCENRPGRDGYEIKKILLHRLFEN